MLAGRCLLTWLLLSALSGIAVKASEETTEAPTTEAPTTAAPEETEAPTTEAPTTEAPTTATEAPATTTATATEAPATEAPGTEAPGTEAPATEAPATEAPGTEAPGTEAPATEAPATEAPSTEAPATEAPATEAPATEAPGTEAPGTEAPATEAPATEAPATEAPATEAPATEAPATEAPVTEAPATEAPTTESPATEAPATEAPATEAPTTEAPVVTTLKEEAKKGETSVTVAKQDDFKTGEEIVIDKGTSIEETNTIVSFGSITLKTPLKYDHGVDAKIETVAATTAAPATEAPATEAPTTTNEPTTTTLTTTTLRLFPGRVVTNLQQASGPGDTVIDVESDHGFYPGQEIEIAPGLPTAESNRVEKLGHDGALHLTGAVQATHPVNTVVRPKGTCENWAAYFSCPAGAKDDLDKIKCADEAECKAFDESICCLAATTGQPLGPCDTMPPMAPVITPAPPTTAAPPTSTLPPAPANPCAQVVSAVSQQGARLFNGKTGQTPVSALGNLALFAMGCACVALVSLAVRAGARHSSRQSSTRTFAILGQTPDEEIPFEGDIEDPPADETHIPLIQ